MVQHDMPGALWRSRDDVRAPKCRLATFNGVGLGGRTSVGPAGDRRCYLEQIRVLKAGSQCLYTYSWNWRIRPWLDLVGFESRREMINRD